MGSDPRAVERESAIGRASRVLLGLVPVAAIAVVLLGCGAMVAHGVDFVVCHVTIDDSYYYLNTAWNVRHLGWVTFDGVHPTNGVQFLWFWTLCAFAFLFEDKAAYLVGSVWLCAAVGALAVAAAWRLGELVRGRAGGALLAGCVAFGVADVATCACWRTRRTCSSSCSRSTSICACSATSPRRRRPRPVGSSSSARC